MGYIKIYCPLLQNKKENIHHKRAIKTIWSDDSDSSLSDDEEHVVNMCFMAIKNDNKVMSSDDESDLFYNELHDSFETLYNKYKKLAFKYNLLKKKLCIFTR